MKHKLVVGLGTLAFALSGVAIAKNISDIKGMQQIGSVQADFDGSKQKWVTLQGQIGDDYGASANWTKAGSFTAEDVADIAEQMKDMLQDQLSPEQIKQLEQLGGADNPMAQLLSQMQSGDSAEGEEIEISITAFDPKADTETLMNNAIGININLDSTDYAKQSIGKPIPANISYIVESNGFMPKVLYASDEDKQPASVVFEKLDFNENNGAAKGTFTAYMCRLDMSNLMAGLNTSDCKNIKGSFDTKLVFDKD